MFLIHLTFSFVNIILVAKLKPKPNSVAWVCERTIPTDFDNLIPILHLIYNFAINSDKIA
jgi:hypothetical protein